MGLFDGLFKKGGSQNASPVKPAVQSETLNLTKEKAVETLNLRKESFSLVLKKKALDNTVARVAFVIDESGSMQGQYRNGTVQSTVERLLPIGLRLDDNAELDIFLFSTRFKRLPSITEKDFYGYVDREVMKRVSWGGTRYAPIINDIVQKYAKEEPSPVPTFVIFVTDGDNTDEADAERAIIEASKYNIFFQFVGIGREDFEFLKKLDDLEGRTVDNANFLKIDDINKVSDEQLYDKLMTEYPLWLKEANKLGMLR